MPWTPGGHLKIQESIVPNEVEFLWWNVPSELGGVRKGDLQGDFRSMHTHELDAWLAKARELGIGEMAKVVRDLIGGGRPPTTTTRTVLIESDIDRFAVAQLMSYLKELWRSEFHSQELVPFLIPWPELNCGGEELLKDCHGVIFVYSSKKSPAALRDQIAKIDGKLFSVPTNPGRAIAVAPPRKGPIGWPLNFRCELLENQLALDDGDREILRDFLHAVHNSAGIQ